LTLCLRTAYGLQQQRGRPLGGESLESSASRQTFVQNRDYDSEAMDESNGAWVGFSRAYNRMY
jgi:hypothetical protein